MKIDKDSKIFILVGEMFLEYGHLLEEYRLHRGKIGAKYPPQINHFTDWTNKRKLEIVKNYLEKCDAEGYCKHKYLAECIEMDPDNMDFYKIT